MTLTFHHVETHRESSLHLFPTKKLAFSTEKSIWTDNHQNTAPEEPQQNPACVIHEGLLFKHIIWSEKHFTTLDWILQHIKNNTFPCFASLLWWPIDFLSWFPETAGAHRYDTKLSHGDRIKAESLKLTFHSVRSKNNVYVSFDKGISAAQQRRVATMNLNRAWESRMWFYHLLSVLN